MAIGQSRASRLVLPMSERDHIQGPPDAPLALVEYGDYECPYCGLACAFRSIVTTQIGAS